jgi:hypothetical protein
MQNHLPMLFSQRRIWQKSNHLIVEDHQMRNIIAITIMMLLLATTGYGATYYIDGTSGLDANTGTIGSPWKTLNKANTTLVAGDTVYIRGGTYTVGDYSDPNAAKGIMPSNSGTSGNPITYSTYQDEVVNFIGQADSGVFSVGIWINQKSYIKVTGQSLGQLNFSKMGVNLIIGPWTMQTASNDSSYNEIAYAYFYDSFENDGWAGWDWQGSVIWKQAYYNHVHHCKFEQHGYLTTQSGGNEGNLFDLGGEQASSASSRTYYNVIENNEFSQAGHATFGMFGDHNVIRNNYFHNEGWYDIDGDLYGYRNIIGNGVSGYVGYNLFEGNRIGHAAPNYTYDGKNGNWGGTGMKVCHPYNIERYNLFFNNSSGAFGLSKYGGIYTARASYNYIYNNTFFKNGYYLKLPGEDYIYFKQVGFGYIGDGDWSVIYGSVLKNNLFYNNANTRSSMYDVWNCSGGSTLADIVDTEKGNCTIENNYNDSAGENIDPKFTDETLSSTTSWTLPDLSLQSSSPCIDAGSYLTQANGSGSNSTSLIVDDARYFQDGNFGQGTLVWPSSVEMYADWIAIGTVSNAVQISEINYSTNTITLISPKTWADNAYVWLYKKSDGKVVLNGAAPDMGANEYPISPPKNFRIVQ